MRILCPICKNELKRIDRQYKCPNNHSYDIAKEGYLNLNTHPSKNSGDEKEMIKARKAFLNKDHYLFLKDELNNIFKSYEGHSLIDLACGEGYYTSYFDVAEKIGIDLSKEGLKLASKSDKSTTYLLSSIFNTSLEDECTDLALTCFAPVAKQEITRLLRKDGHFVLVEPGERHLFELKAAIYEKPYLNIEETVDIPGMEVEKRYEIHNSSLLDNGTLKDLFTMTPYYHKTSLDDIRKLDVIESLEVSFSFIITIYKKI